MRETGRGPGSLAIEMSRLHALDCAFGSLLQLQFRVAAGASGTLRIDLVEATLNETRLTLNPAPQLGADPTDGAIRVNPPDQPVTPFAAFAPDNAVTSNIALSPLIDFNSHFNGFAFKAGDNKSWLGDWLTDTRL